MSERTLQIIDATRARLRAAGRRIVLARLLSGVVIAVGCFAAFWFLAALIEASLWLSPPIRMSIMAFGAVGMIAVLSVFVGLPLLRLLGVVRGQSAEDIAARVEAAVPPARDRLMAFLHLAGGKHTSSPREMVEEALHALYEPFSESSFDRVETYGGLRRALKYGAAPLVLLASFMLAAPGPFGEATNRLMEPMTAFVRPAPFTLSVSPGDVQVLRGDSVAIQVSVVGRSEEAPVVEIKRSSENVERVETGMNGSAASYLVVETNIRRPFEYRAAAGDVTSRWYRVAVLERPLVRQLEVVVSSPRYSRIGTVRLDPDAGDVTALPGSVVDLTVNLGGGETVVADVVFDDGSKVPLKLENATATGRFRLTRAGTYHVELVTVDGITNESPIEYRMELLNDARPSVAIVSPGHVAELAEPFEINVLARIIDDFGFSKMSLFYRLAESRFGPADETFGEIPISIDSPFELDQVVAKEWSVSGRSGAPVPGDVIEYFLRVWDNDSYAGFKPTDSRIHRLVMPSLAERFREMNEEVDDASDRLEDFVETADEIDERFQELRRELQQKPESDWDDQRRLDQLESMQEQLEKNIENVSSGLQDLAEKMQGNSLVSEETLEMFEQLRKAIDEINSPELMEALQKLRESMQNLDLQQMQESMNDFEFSEEQFKERLKRALDLFKRLQAYQGLEEAARRAEELAKRQEEIREATSSLEEKDPEDRRNESESQSREQDGQQAEQMSEDSPGGETEEKEQQSDDQRDRNEDSRSDQSDMESEKDAAPDRLAAEQQRSEEEMRELEKRLQEIQEMMDEMPQNAGQQLQQLRDQVRQQQLPEEMQRNAEQLRNQELQPAMEGQQQMQQQLSRLQEQLSQMQQNMRGNQLQLNIAGLRQVLNDILVLSQQQEETRNDVSDTEADSPALRNYARLQVELGEGLRVVSDTLQKLSREIPEMSRQVQAETGKALREIQLATESLADRSARRASGHQKASMMHLNELALLLSDLLNMLMNQQMGMGMPSMQQMLEQMQQMAGQQQQLNDQIQQMLNDMHGQRLTKDMQARMRQLAEQQARIREQLKEMSRNPELRGKALGDLDKIAEQMEETIRQLEHSRVNREMIERQQQILTRLLDASRSINQRGKEDRREGRTGGDLERESPSDLTPEEQVNQLRRDLIRALESGYAQDYEELIRKYFNLLQQELEPVPVE